MRHQFEIKVRVDLKDVAEISLPAIQDELLENVYYCVERSRLLDIGDLGIVEDWAVGVEESK